MTEASLHDELRELSAALQEAPPPAELRSRVIEAAAPSRRRPAVGWRLPVLAFAAGAVLVWWLRPSAPPPTAPEDAAVVVAPSPVRDAEPPDGQPRCAATLGASPIAIAAPCRVVVADLDVRVDVWSDARMARDGRTLRLLEGAATFDVTPVGEGEPIEVDVGAGRVRVLGTRFEIQNTGARGHLDLIHGRVEFHDRDGVVAAVEPGVRFSWDRAARPSLPLPAAVEAPAPDPGPSAPTPRAPAKAVRPIPAPELDLDALLDEVARKRLAGERALAEGLLRTAAKGQRGATAEVLSFELGTLLDLHETSTAACEHWGHHLAAFAGGSSIVRAKQHMTRLGCDTDE